MLNTYTNTRGARGQGVARRPKRTLHTSTAQNTRNAPPQTMKTRPLSHPNWYVAYVLGVIPLTRYVLHIYHVCNVPVRIR